MKSKKKKTAESIADTMKQQGKKTIYSDVDGSYTGTPTGSDSPIQDVDDL